jgi:Homeodomain-like domain
MAAEPMASSAQEKPLMTPEAEAEFIRLWQQGASYRAIAQALGCPLGTVASRSAALVAQGTIQPRRRAKARPEGAPATPATPAAPLAPAPPAVTFVAVPEIQEMLSLMKDLQARVISLEQTRVPPTTPALPAPPAGDRKDIQQWTVRLSKALIEHIKAVAYARRIPPSQLVEELVLKAFSDHQP